MKRIVSTLILAAVLTISSSQAFAGIVVVTVTEQPTQCENQKTGIVVVTLTGILMGDFTGILMGDYIGTGSCDN